MVEYKNQCDNYGVCDLVDKNKRVRSYIDLMLARTLRMFEYSGLPDTIPVKDFERMMQMGSYSFVTKVNDELYAFMGGLGGIQDVYYHPTRIVISNPALNFNADLDVKEDGVLCRNDSMMVGLRDLFERYATMLVENDITMYLSDIWLRDPMLFSAKDDPTAESAKLYLKDLISGKLGVIMDSKFQDSFTSNGKVGSSRDVITPLISYQQYLKASWFNEIGLNANYNMKRESINSEEAQMNDDALLPLIDDMLRTREDFVAKINEKYGTNITVKLGKAWEEKRAEIVTEVVDGSVEKDGDSDDQID